MTDEPPIFIAFTSAHSGKGIVIRTADVHTIEPRADGNGTSIRRILGTLNTVLEVEESFNDVLRTFGLAPEPYQPIQDPQRSQTRVWPP
jgi:hypothetical protein